MVRCHRHQTLRSHFGALRRHSGAPELRSAPTPLRSYSGALRSAPEHINIVAPTLQTPLIHVVFPSSCVSHTSGALQPHAGALRSAPTPLRSSSGALRSAPTPLRSYSGAHQYCRYDAPNPTDTYDFPPSCVSHTFGALRPHSGALRSTSILSLRRSKPH